MDDSKKELLEQVRIDWECGMKYKDIAEKYNIPESTIKSWVNRYFKNGETPKIKVATKNETKKKGGSPLHNTNAVKSGIYRSVYLSSLSDDEKKVIEEATEMTAEEKLEQQINILTIREYRLLNTIKEKYSNINELSNQSASITQESNNQKMNSQKITSNKTSNINYYVMLETELTRVQKAKAKAILTLEELRMKKRELENNAPPEFEDDNLVEAIKNSMGGIWEDDNTE